MIRDMTRGNVTRHLVSFSVPIILGNLFQLAYNAVDSIVVGRFAGTGALAAVGTANPVMNIIILGVSGLCIGASVLMSEYFGARDTEKLRREFAATLFLGMFFSAAVLALKTTAITRAIKSPSRAMRTAVPPSKRSAAVQMKRKKSLLAAQASVLAAKALQMPTSPLRAK